MKYFSHLLAEEQDIGPAPKDLTDPDEVERWIQEWLSKDKLINRGLFEDYEKHDVRGNGDVSITCSWVNFDNLNQRTIRNFKKRIPLNFLKINGAMQCRGCEWIESFEGFPRTINGTLNVAGTGISSWENCPTDIGKLVLNDKLLENLDISVIKRVSVDTISGILPANAKIARLAYFPSLINVLIGDEIIRKLIMQKLEDARKQNMTPRQSALALQTALIEADFEEYADL